MTMNFKKILELVSIQVLRGKFRNITKALEIKLPGITFYPEFQIWRIEGQVGKIKLKTLGKITK